ncbi:hypothetical protein D3C87_1581800 [compost metagenome]
MVTHCHDRGGGHGVAFPLPTQVLDHGLGDGLLLFTFLLELQHAWAEVKLVGVPVEATQATPEVPELGMWVVYGIEQARGLTQEQTAVAIVLFFGVEDVTVKHCN